MSDEPNWEILEKKVATYTEILDTVPVDRLSLLQNSFKVRNFIVACLRMLDPLADSELSAHYPTEDLETIYAHLIDSAESLRDLLVYFMKKAQVEAAKYRFAI